MKTDIINAIRNHNLIEFYYDGGIRIVEPHCYGITTANNEGIRAYQIRGFSSSGNLGWKMFDLSKATSINVLDETFINARFGYKKHDRGMSKIFKEL
jgi:hypothetical protein